jgi:uncharacterized protein (DUF1015 family)
MTMIIPFRGITYNPAGSPLAKVIAPPLEALSADSLSEIREQHPQNITRMLYPEGDSSGAESARIFRAWTATGVMTREKNPVVYVVEQVCKTAEEEQCRRRGFIALWKFDEQPTPMNPQHIQRLNWIVDSGLWPAPLCALYNDPTRRIDRYLSFALRSVPALDVTIGGVRTSVWKLSDGGAIAGIVRELKEKPVGVVGDGSDISLACALRSRYPLQAATGLYGFVPTLFINAGEPGLISVPMHRLYSVHHEFSAETVRNRIDQTFTLTAFEHKNECTMRLAGYGAQAVAIGFSGEQKYYLAVLKEPAPVGEPDAVVPVRYAQAIFDEIIHSVWGDVSGDQRMYDVQYTSDQEKVMTALDSGQIQVACFVNPAPVDSVLSTILSGLPIPGGVVEIYPHLPLGIVLHTFQE